MKKLAYFGMSLLTVVAFVAGPTLAAPFKADNNPLIVANYPTGDHGIVGEPVLHNGADVVMRAGNSGNFQQWFYGTAAEEGVVTEGDHSVWLISKDGTCPSNFVLVPSANPDWGDYLVAGADYCVHTNDYHVTK